MTMARACWMEWALRKGWRTLVLRPGPTPTVDIRVRRTFWWWWQKALVVRAGDWQRRPLVLVWRQRGYSESLVIMAFLSADGLDFKRERPQADGLRPLLLPYYLSIRVWVKLKWHLFLFIFWASVVVRIG